MADEISTTGKWVDTTTGQVVDSEPTEGRQLVAPGSPITPQAAHRIRQAEETAPVVETATAPEAEEDEVTDDSETENTEAPAGKETATTTARKRAASK